MTKTAYNVLFLCTGNPARSVMAECNLNRIGGGRFTGYSAGSHPKGAIHPVTLEFLQEFNYKTESLRSKDWAECARPDAPAMDFVFTVCDRAAGEVCPIWPGQPMTAHRGLPDPVEATGTPERVFAVFNDVYRQIEKRLQVFTNLPIESLDRLALQRRLDAMGRALVDSVT
ncbi:MAG: arsenate reductase ArsC [Alphaproteobacteria bacterium]|nr:arsenate reductase ArsC [Alphaproteobacteria bacterium]